MSEIRDSMMFSTTSYDAASHKGHEVVVTEFFPVDYHMTVSDEGNIVKGEPYESGSFYKYEGEILTCLDCEVRIHGSQIGAKMGWNVE